MNMTQGTNPNIQQWPVHAQQQENQCHEKTVKAIFYSMV